MNWFDHKLYDCNPDIMHTYVCNDYIAIIIIKSSEGLSVLNETIQCVNVFYMR